MPNLFGTALVAILSTPLLFSQDPCSVEGEVTNEATGLPVAKALVVLAQFQANPRIPSGGYTIATDAEGRYQATGLQPGSYRLMAKQNGFMTSDFGAAPRKAALGSPSAYPEGKTLTLATGQKLGGVDFKLRPFGAITGRVTGSDGEPMVGMTVGVMSLTYQNGARQMAPRSSAATNDLGEYRITGIPPGSYYVCATPTYFSSSGEDRSARLKKEEDISTCYPGTPGPNGAALVNAPPGRAAEGTNIKLLKTAVTTIRGRVLNLPAGGPPASIQAVSPSNAVLEAHAVRPDPQGRFEIRGITPGTYRLEARGGNPEDIHMAVEQVEVGSEPVENVTLSLSAGAPILGSVKIEDGASIDLKRVMITLGLVATGVSFRGNSANPAADGSFTLAKVFPYPMELFLSGWPAGYYLKSVRLGARELNPASMNLVPGPEVLEVVLAAGAPAISGVVKDADDAPLPGATVVLVPQDVSLRKSSFARRAYRAGDAGKFTIPGAPPGDYKLYAWAEVEPGAWTDPDFMRPIESKGVAVAARQGGSYTVDLKAIPPREQTQ